MTIGQKIRLLRKKQGWTQGKLADMIDVSPNLVSKWEKSERFPGKDSVEKLATCFKQTTHFFAPEKSQLIMLRIFDHMDKNELTFQFDDWKDNYRYEKIASHLINSDIFEEDITKFTQDEIDNRYFLFKDEYNQIHIIRYDFNRIVSKRFYALKSNNSLIIRQLFSSEKNGAFYTIYVENSILEKLINTLKQEKEFVLDKEDIIKMKNYSEKDNDVIVGIVVASIRMIQ